MIKQLDLKTFKCFESLSLPLAPLTLLSGTNASGKSSVLQAVVLLHQTMQDNEWSTRLFLNGSVAQLGTVTDVVDKNSGTNSFEIRLADDDNGCHWWFVGDRSDMSMRVGKVEVPGNVTENPNPLQYLLPTDAGETASALAAQVRTLTYISAEREGPREVYPLEDQYAVTRVGPRGENAVSVLYRRGDEPTYASLMITGTAPTLQRQVGARLDTFFPGCAIDVQQVQNTNAVTLGISTSEATGFVRPVHSGFGITQILPIVVAALSVPEGSLLLIENPEVHLHPAGQALMGRFLADVAHSGIQVIVETHSDHFMDGVRIAVRDRLISPNEAAFHFFERDGNKSVVTSPEVDENGRLSQWPTGFFDQHTQNMMKLLAPG